MAAIYMWPPKPGTTIVLTTTLYPVEVVDAIVFGVSINAGFMALLPASDMTFSMGTADGLFVQERWFTSDGPYDSDMAFSMGTDDGLFVQERWFFSDGPYDSDMAFSMGTDDGLFENKLVIADTPDEKLQLSIAIDDTCTMDLI